MNNNLIINADKIASSEYNEWFEDLKSRYRKSQIKAAIKVSNELLKFYWSLGRDIVGKKAEEKWGSVKPQVWSEGKAFPCKQKGVKTI